MLNCVNELSNGKYSKTECVYVYSVDCVVFSDFFGERIDAFSQFKNPFYKHPIQIVNLLLRLRLHYYFARFLYSMSEKPADESSEERNNVVVKIGMVGDAQVQPICLLFLDHIASINWRRLCCQVGKTTLMVKYVENKFDEDYIQTLGVNFMEKSITLRNTEITFSIWDLGGQREFISMLPLVCNDAVTLFFMFDLSRKSTLLSIKEWYRQARGLNRTALAFLVGTKYDMFTALPPEEQEEIDKLARKYGKAMKAPVIFTSASHSINVQKIFKIVLSKVFELKSTLETIEGVGEPLLIF